MTKKSIISVIGRKEVFRLMEKAVVQAADRNKAAGLATASYVNGRIVITPGKQTSTTSAIALKAAANIRKLNR